MGGDKTDDDDPKRFSSSSNVAFGPTLDHPFPGGLVLLQTHSVATLIQHGVGLHEDLSRRSSPEHLMAKGRGPEVGMDGGHAFVQRPTGLDVGRRLEDVELLQVALHGRSAVAEDLAPIEHDP